MLKDLIEFNSFSTKITVREFIENGKSLENINIPENDLKQYWRMHESHKDKCIQENTDFISPVLYDNSDLEIDNLGNKDIINNDVTQNVQNQENMPNFDISKMSPEELNFDSIEPNFLTYYPNSNYPFYEDEPMWILPTLKYDFIWDFTMSPLQETLNNLINRPLKNKSLSEEQINYILETIGENPNILKEINYKPECLMNLIEKNDDLATQILLKISNHNGFEDYLTLFLENTWTVNSMKVANKIIQKVEMPEAFITTYLKHIIENYKNEKKKENKTRLARLTAFFITNLLDHEHINIKMIPVQIDEIFSEKTKDEDIQKLQNKINQMKSKENE
jgi:hypothetical protein